MKNIKIVKLEILRHYNISKHVNIALYPQIRKYLHIYLFSVNFFKEKIFN